MPRPPSTDNPAAEVATGGITLAARCALPGFALEVDLRLPGTGITVLFGPSGSGKTTCLRVLAGLEPRATGTVRVGAETWLDSAAGLCVPVHRRALGYVFQEASLLPHLNVQQNLRFGFDRTPPAQRRHDWDAGLPLLGIAHLLKRMPHELSGGERQRVAMARALATSPRLLLMDEPLAALDAARKADILPWLEGLHTTLDMPVVYVTHSVDELVRLADHVVLLQGGRLQAQGPAHALLTRTDLPLAQADDASTLIEARVSAHVPEDHVVQLAFPGGQLLLPMDQPPPTGRLLRLRIQAKDVSLALDPPGRTSLLNVLPATVTEVNDTGAARTLVRLDVGSPSSTATTPLLSRISSLSARRLGLAPGMAVQVQIKGVSLVR